MFTGFNGFNPVNLWRNWKQSDEEHQWQDKTKNGLVKILKKQGFGLDVLEKQLRFPGNQEPCVTIRKSKDGRLQVSHRKGLPHVFSCRVYRFPDLQSYHELRAEPWCRNPFR